MEKVSIHHKASISAMQTHEHRHMCSGEVSPDNFRNLSKAHTVLPQPTPTIYNLMCLLCVCVQSTVYYALQRGGGKQILVMNRSQGNCRHCDEQIELCRGVWVKEKL